MRWWLDFDLWTALTYGAAALLLELAAAALAAAGRPVAHVAGCLGLGLGCRLLGGRAVLHLWKTLTP